MAPKKYKMKKVARTEDRKRSDRSLSPVKKSESGDNSSSKLVNHIQELLDEAKRGGRNVPQSTELKGFVELINNRDTMSNEDYFERGLVLASQFHTVIELANILESMKNFPEALISKLKALPESQESKDKLLMVLRSLSNLTTINLSEPEKLFLSYKKCVDAFMDVGCSRPDSFRFAGDKIAITLNTERKTETMLCLIDDMISGSYSDIGY